MITDEQVRWIALFFLLTFMDEKTAVDAAGRSIAILKSKVSLKNSDQAIGNVALIRVLSKVFEQFRKMNPRNRPFASPEGAWGQFEPVALESWSRFQKDSSDAEVIAVVLSHVLKFTDSEIAEGLNVSMGTTRYRIGKGVRQLGMARRLRA